MTNTCDTLIYNALILTVNESDHVIENGAIAISDGLICAVGATSELRHRFAAKEEIDAQGAIVHPGFIDPHIHISQYTARSVLPRMHGTDVTMGHWKAALTPEDEYASARLAAFEYLAAGYTGFVDPGTIFTPEAVAPVAEEAGIRIWMTDPYVADRGVGLIEKLPELACPEFIDRWPRTTEEAIERIGRVLDSHFAKGSDTLVRAHIGIYGEMTASPELMSAASRAAQKAGVQLHLHMGYAPESYLDEEGRYGKPMLDVLADCDCLGPHVTLSHMNLVRETEIGRLRNAGVRLIWSPWGTLQAIGRGQAEPRMPELMRAGVPVGLATDIPRKVNFDSLPVLAAAAAAAGGAELSPTEMLRLRTIGAAATLGADADLGSLESGKYADLVIRYPIRGQGPGVDPVYEVALLGGARSVDQVFLRGIRVVDGGEPLRLQEHEVVQRARTSVEGLTARIGLAGR